MPHTVSAERRLYAQNDHHVKVLGLAIGDSSLSQIIRGQLNRYAITGNDSNIVFSHPSGNMSYNLMAVFKFDLELSPW